MTRIPRLRRSARPRIKKRHTRAAKPTLNSKPEPGREYVDWLERIWPGDTRELREGRFLHQQGNLRVAFEQSDFWLHVRRNLSEWAHTYEIATGGYLLFPGAPALPSLHNKPWVSFLSRTWRENVHTNDRWPDQPADGWWLPDNWFERAWDIVRTRFVVRYLDGVEELAEQLVASARKAGHEAEYEKQAKEGFHAFQVSVRQPFPIDTLDYQGTIERSSAIELQVMTDLADVISQLTHPHYERRRESQMDGPLAWKYWSREAETSLLGTQLHALEMQVWNRREELRTSTSASGPKPGSGPRTKHVRPG